MKIIVCTFLFIISCSYPSCYKTIDSFDKSRTNKFSGSFKNYSVNETPFEKPDSTNLWLHLLNFYEGDDATELRRLKPLNITLETSNDKLYVISNDLHTENKSFFLRVNLENDEVSFSDFSVKFYIFANGWISKKFILQLSETGKLIFVMRDYRIGFLFIAPYAGLDIEGCWTFNRANRL